MLVSEADSDAVTSRDGVRYHTAKTGRRGLGFFRVLVDAEIAADYVLIITDSCILGPSFRKTLELGMLNGGWDIVYPDPTFQEVIALYSCPFIQRQRDVFLSLSQLPDASPAAFRSLRETSNTYFCFADAPQGQTRSCVASNSPTLLKYLPAFDIYAAKSIN